MHNYPSHTKMDILLRSMPFFPLIVMVALAAAPHSHGLNPQTKEPDSLVPSSTQVLYHRGPILTGKPSINIYLIWYGAFSPSYKIAISDFFASFNPSSRTAPGQPSISTWWKTTQAYRDMAHRPVASGVAVKGQVSNTMSSLGKNLKRIDLANLVRNAIGKRVFPLDPNGVYFVLTAPDIAVERFCMGSCGFHDTIMVSPRQRVVLAHVGDPRTQCPGLCAWPFAVPMYGPPGPPLIAPNGVGIDGMVMNMATILAGAATNPYKNGYFQGAALAPLEAVTACSGIFGSGAYPGYPGKLLIDQKTKASYNAYSISGRRFLLPAMWDLPSQACKAVA